MEDREHPFSLLYFSSESCGVCHSLLPKIRVLLATEFPYLLLKVLDIDEDRAKTQRYLIYSVPATLLLFDGREQDRVAGVFSLAQLRDMIERPYRLYYD